MTPLRICSLQAKVAIPDKTDIMQQFSQAESYFDEQNGCFTPRVISFPNTMLSFLGWKVADALLNKWAM